MKWRNSVALAQTPYDRRSRPGLVHSEHGTAMALLSPPGTSARRWSVSCNRPVVRQVDMISVAIRSRRWGDRTGGGAPHQAQVTGGCAPRLPAGTQSRGFAATCRSAQALRLAPSPIERGLRQPGAASTTARHDDYRARSGSPRCWEDKPRKDGSCLPAAGWRLMHHQPRSTYRRSPGSSAQSTTGVEEHWCPRFRVVCELSGNGKVGRIFQRPAS